MADSKDLRAEAELDDIDRRMIAALAENARVSNARLAELAGVAPSTAHARLRSLVDRGVVTGFRAAVSPTALGLGLQALISVSVRAGSRHLMTEFLDEVKGFPGVVQVFFLGGSEDFIVHVAVRDSQAVRDFVVENLSAHPMVGSTRTSLVFEHHSTPVGRS